MKPCRPLSLSRLKVFRWKILVTHCGSITACADQMLILYWDSLLPVEILDADDKKVYDVINFYNFDRNLCKKMIFNKPIRSVSIVGNLTTGRYS